MVVFAVPMYDPHNKKTQPEIPAEKQRLAASLFGGSSSQKAANGVKGSKPAAAANLRPGEKGASSKPSGLKEKIPNIAQPKQASAPLIDLMDMSEGDSFSSAPVAKPSYDPFKELEGLLDGPSTMTATPQKSSVDFMSLYDSTPSTTNDANFLSLGLTSSSGMEAVNGPQAGAGLLDLNEFPATGPLAGLAGLAQQSSSATVLPDRKGPSLQDSLQKDATTRQVGVTPTGTNPALFQDLFG